MSDSDILNSTTSNSSPCTQCQLPATFTCERCNKKPYCGRSCQKAHWISSHKAECVILPQLFDPDKETHITLSREALGLLINREVDLHEWMLISSLRNTSSFGIEAGTRDMPENAHGEKPYALCTIERDELKAYMAASKKYLGNIEWNALVSAMHFTSEYENDVEKVYEKATGRGTGMPCSRAEQAYKEWLVSKEIKFKSPADVVRNLLEKITIPSHFMGKYIS